MKSLTYNQVFFYFLIHFVQSFITISCSYAGCHKLLIPRFKFILADVSIAQAERPKSFTCENLENN